MRGVRKTGGDRFAIFVCPKGIQRHGLETVADPPEMCLQAVRDLVAGPYATGRFDGVALNYRRTAEQLRGHDAEVGDCDHL